MDSAVLIHASTSACFAAAVSGFSALAFGARMTAPLANAPAAARRAAAKTRRPLKVWLVARGVMSEIFAASDRRCNGREGRLWATTGRVCYLPGKPSGRLPLRAAARGLRFLASRSTQSLL